MQQGLRQTDRITMADMLDRSVGKMVKLCMGDNVYIQGIIGQVQEDFLSIKRDPITHVPLDRIIWFQFLE